MCDCENNVVDLQQIKIYTIMAKYKALVEYQQIRYGDGNITSINVGNTQEELAFIYEVLGLTKLVEKTEKTEKTKTRKSDDKKVSKDKKESVGSEKESGKDKKDQE
jgi:hypothetical protein